ncbi:MAG: hypothetical protein HGN29_16585 [Asgard group archaeon]|nr:hypothetical protein [Asgard group archaeon]
MHKKFTRNMQFLFFSLLLINSFFPSFNIVGSEDINEREILSSDPLGSQKLAEIPSENPPNLDYIDQNDMNVYTTSDRFEGYNLFVVNRLYSKSNDIILLVTDMDGNVLKEKYLGTKTYTLYVSPKFINATHILYGAPDGARLWNYYTDEDVSLGFYGHHEYEYNPVQETFFTINRYTEIINEVNYYFDHIQEYDSTGNKIWELSTFTFHTIDMWCYYEELFNFRPDISHSNSIFFDAEEDMIYCNSRNTNTFYKIDHSTGIVEWALGEYGDFTLYDLKGNVKNNLFYHAHAVEKIDDNKFLLFDNDYHNQTDEESNISRLVEITIDENTMTANETWTWEAPSSYYSDVWGDADPLPNGNVFGTFGAFEHDGYISIGARMIEVNTTGDIVWEMNFPMTNYHYGIYRAERFGLSPFINASSKLFAGSGTEISATFQTWYNFRSKIKTIGSYDLYLDDALIDTDSVQFDKFWRVKNLTFELGILPDGQHNLTVAIADEAGHTTIKTIFINIGPFYIEKTGPTEMEIGETNSIISWSGYAISPLEFNLIINDTNEITDTWSGEIVEYDLNELIAGIHNFTVQLYNGTELVFNETFWVTIFPYSPPVFNSFPSDQSITWNDYLMLSWNVSDSTLYKIELYFDGTLARQIDFSIPPLSYVFDYVFPLVDEGNYNVTLLIIDRTLGSVLKTTWIEVAPPSPPIISQFPMNDFVQWGHQNTSFIWEVHGESDSSWKLLKNESIYASGVLSNKIIEISIEDWYDIEWYLGTYNLTLSVEDTYGNTTISTVFIKIAIAGDPYVNAIIEIASLFYYNGENAIGAPDGECAQIFADYSNGFITLDMGRDEEIVDGDGDDFTIISSSGRFDCWVGNNLEESFVFLGSGEGNTSFDLNAKDLDSARYVRIEYTSGIMVRVDAIVALNYLILESDSESPEIIGPDDFVINNNVTSFTISWLLYDITPFNFSITINDEVYDSGPWNGSDITLTYVWDELGLYEVELILYDIFGNHASDIVNVQVENQDNRPYLYFLFLLSLAAIPIFLLQRKRKV